MPIVIRKPFRDWDEEEPRPAFVDVSSMARQDRIWEPSTSDQVRQRLIESEERLRDYRLHKKLASGKLPTVVEVEEAWR